MGRINRSFLYYFGARYYDPELGRFITADPTIAHPFDPQDLNRYSYVRNNPINYTDPTGLSWWSAFWSFVAGFFGAVTAVIVTALTGGNFVLGMAAGGAVAGAILGGVSGGWEGALKGAAIGFLVGGAMGIGLDAGGAYFAVGALIAGATYAGVTGGAEGLGDFAAGMAGSAVGGFVGNAIVSNHPLGATSVNAGTADPSTPAEIQQSDRASADIQGVIDAASQGRGTSLGRIIVTPEDVMPATNYGPRMGRIVGSIGLKGASDIKLKVPYNGRITFSPYGKGIVARAANALGVSAKWFGRTLGAVGLANHLRTGIGNLRAGGGWIQGMHDAVITGSDIAGFFPPTRFAPQVAQAVDMASEYWANRIYGVN